MMVYIYVFSATMKLTPGLFCVRSTSLLLVRGNRGPAVTRPDQPPAPSERGVARRIASCVDTQCLELMTGWCCTRQGLVEKAGCQSMDEKGLVT